MHTDELLTMLLLMLKNTKTMCFEPRFKMLGSCRF